MGAATRRAVGPEEALRTSRIILGALVAGVVTFVGVTAVIRAGGADIAADPAAAALFTYVWLAVTAGSLGFAAFFWKTRVAPLQADARGPDPGGAAMDPGARSSALVTHMIVAWALVEGPALFGVVLYFLFGNVWFGAAGVLLMAGAAAVTWPKREDFGLR